MIWLHIFVSLCTLVFADLKAIHCDSNISSILTTKSQENYMINVSSIPSRYKTSKSLFNLELVTNPVIPIEIYFTNGTIHTSCITNCDIKLSTKQNYIIRLDKFLKNNDPVNYTLHTHCYLPSTLSKLSLTFSPNFGFTNRGNILSFGSSILIVLIFITIGLFVHYESSRIELLFLARPSNAPFYLISIVTVSFCIIMSSTRLYLNQHLLGILIALTMTSINLVAVIGMKYYGSWIKNIKIKNTNLTLARLSRWATLVLFIIYLIFYYVALHIGLSLSLIVWTITITELIVLSMACFASKTAQVQWSILFILIWLIDHSTYEYIFFSFYWYSFFCIGCALGSIFLFSNKEYSKYLKSMFVKVFGAFISIFDIATDITVMALWISNRLYFWTIMQLIFIFSGTVYGAFYIDDYYFIDDGYVDGTDDVIKRRNTETKEKAKRYVLYLISVELQLTHKIIRLFWGRIFTLVGLGRVYHGILGWDQDRHKDMDISNRILKVWEMIFVCF